MVSTPLRYTAIALVFSLGGCGLLAPSPSLDTLWQNNTPSIVVAKMEPRVEYQCIASGFVPCHLNEPKSGKLAETEQMQCAKNILPFVQKANVNYLYISAPMQLFGMNWREAKAVFYRCAWLPMPVVKPEAPSRVSSPLNNAH